jgi:hypothetical protein
MKNFILLFAALIISAAAFAQQKRAVLSPSLENRVYPAPVPIDDYSRFSNPANSVANSKAVLDEVLGGSDVYDQQTNSSMQSRIYLWPDGTLAATWIKSDVSGNADRGTGYNYFNGTSWGPAPTSRLESVKSGWPTLNRWMGNGELIISHRTTTELVMHTRPVKGTGAWTETMAPTSPATNALVWPSVITNGNNFQNIHMLCMTRTTANGGSLYKGLDGALLYYRSLDGGATWDKAGIQLPGLDSSNYSAFSGDSYVWIEPHGDTVAFLCGGEWVDTFLMRSYDNGSTWTKLPILPNYYCKNPLNHVTPRFICSDGSFAGVMDKNGVFHVAYGRMRALDDGTGRKYAGGTDGLVYWNSTMPVMDTAIVTDIDTLIAHNLCIGYVATNQAGDTIVDFPLYGVSLSSFPQMTIDQYNNIYFLWSSLTVGNPSPDPMNYRHIWGRAWFNGKANWSEMKDFNADPLYLFQEYTYPAISRGIRNSKLQMITQTSSQPGSNVKDPDVPVHPVNIEYREIPVSEFITAGNTSGREFQGNAVGRNFPNPASGATSFQVTLNNPSPVVVEIYNLMGQKVMSIDQGIVSAGKQTFTVNCSSLTSGVYFYTVKIDHESHTRKMIVEQAR